MRLFTAIALSEAAKDALAGIQWCMLEQMRRGRLTHRDNLHLTLHFLGEVSPERVGDIGRVMDNLSCAPFTLHIYRMGQFERTGGDIWWAGVQESAELLQLQQVLAEGLREAGFPLEERRFAPHVTLARGVAMPDTGLCLLREAMSIVQEVSFVSLMESAVVDGRLVYTEIDRKDLG